MIGSSTQKYSQSHKHTGKYVNWEDFGPQCRRHAAAWSQGGAVVVVEGEGEVGAGSLQESLERCLEGAGAPEGQHVRRSHPPGRDEASF